MAYRHIFQQYVERIVAGGVIEEPPETRNAYLRQDAPTYETLKVSSGRLNLEQN